MFRFEAVDVPVHSLTMVGLDLTDVKEKLYKYNGIAQLFTFDLIDELYLGYLCAEEEVRAFQKFVKPLYVQRYLIVKVDEEEIDFLRECKKTVYDVLNKPCVLVADCVDSRIFGLVRAKNGLDSIHVNAKPKPETYLKVARHDESS